jgi:hypothetical protein
MSLEADHLHRTLLRAEGPKTPDKTLAPPLFSFLELFSAVIVVSWQGTKQTQPVWK